ncbi:MAG: GTPase Era [Bacteroidia bacterium]|nr:GTPase Era [Bacteroidia bacterium]
MGHKSGFVSIVGKPNAGKSTLLNQLLGQKLSIITPKAQTTRNRIFGIDSEEDYQIVYADTPGMIEPKYKLHHKMMEYVGQALADADLVLLLISMDERFPEENLLRQISLARQPKLLVINKIDLSASSSVARREAEILAQLPCDAALRVSALTGEGVDLLKAAILERLPEGPAFFEKDQVTDRPIRFFAAELIREKLFLNLQEELPYSTAVEIVRFEDQENLIKIYANIHVERQSQKGMVIGKGGLMLRKIGTEARQEIEALVENQVYLELYVKVSEDWKNNDNHLRGLGY